MRLSLLTSLAWQDYRDDWRLCACGVLALVAVIAPLLLLFGLKFGLINALTDRLQGDPTVREVIPLAGARFSAEDIALLASRPDVAFVLPRTRQIAATAELLDSHGTPRTVEMIPTSEDDPLLGGLPAPQSVHEVVLSQTAAEKLVMQAGDELQAMIIRQVAGQFQSRRLSLKVVAVLPLGAFPRDAMFAELGLLEAAEDYRDGVAVPAFDWPGTPPGATRTYPAFRLYARDLSAVETLRQHFADRGVTVATQAAAIEQVQSLGRNLASVFWIIAGVAISGAFAAIAAGTLAAVERKRRSLSVLRLLGFPTAALLAVVVLQALYTAVLAAIIASALYAVGAAILNDFFSQAAAHLLPEHFAIALLAVLSISLAAALAGGWGVTRLHAAQGIRDV